MKKPVSISLPFSAFVLVALVAFIPFTRFAVAATVSTDTSFESTSEDTLALCTDGIDNDFNTLTDAADPSCAAVLDAQDNQNNSESPNPESTSTPATSTDPIITSVPENTPALCQDGIDNDHNGMTDLQDPGCAPFSSILDGTSTEATSTPSAEVTTENTLALCTDGIDNDFNTLIDAADPACASVLDAATSTPPAPTPSNSHSDVAPQSGASGGGGSFLPTGPSVLGASTSDESSYNGPSCVLSINSYLKLGKVNDSKDVRTLQAFLNSNLGLHIPVTGYFGPKTDAGVRTLQSKYSKEILQPWVDAKLATNMDPTGYVFKTTRWFINSKTCSTLAFPVLK